MCVLARRKTTGGSGAVRLNACIIRPSWARGPAKRNTRNVKTFAGEIGRGINFHYFFDATIKGEPNPHKENYEKATSKDVLEKR